MKKIISIVLLLLFVLSTIAPFALAEEAPDTTVVWVKNDDTTISNIVAGEVLELFIIASSIEIPTASIHLIGPDDFLKNIASGQALSKVDNAVGLWQETFLVDTNDLVNGNYQVSVAVLNSFGATETQLYINNLVGEVEVNNSGPSFTFDPEWDYLAGGNQFISFPVWERTVGDFFEVNILGSDSDGDDLTITLQSTPGLTLPPGVSLVDNGNNTATVSGVPTAAGEYGFLFTVNDGQDSIQYAMKFVFVEKEVEVIVINPIGDKNVNEDETLTFTVSAQGASENVEYQVLKTIGCQNIACIGVEVIVNVFGNPLPGNAQFDTNTGIYTISPDFDFVEHPDLKDVTKLKFRAFNADVTSPWEYVDLTVNDVNRIPVLESSLVPSELTVNEEGEFTASASDADNDDLTYTWDFADVTPVVKGDSVNHQFASSGDFTVTLTIDDGFGGQVIKTFFIVIKDKEDVLGCTDEDATNYNPLATKDDGNCEYEPVEVLGCTDPIAENFNVNATKDDNSCVYILGCTDKDATNYNPLATKDDGSCIKIVEVLGCTDAKAANFNPNATIDDGSCVSKVIKLAIVSTPVTIATVGELYNYQVLIIPEFANGKVKYELLQAPSGMTIDQNGLITFVPVEDGSSFPVTVRVSRAGLEAFQFYTLTVKDNHGGVKISSVFINPEEVSAGEYIAIYVDFVNNGGEDLEDVQITAVIYDFGIQVQGDKFDLDQGDQRGEVMYVYVPYYAMTGEYLVTVSVRNNDFTEESYRFFYVN